MEHFIKRLSAAASVMDCTSMSALPFDDLPDDVKFNMRMESIFMPSSRAKRDHFYSKPKRFVHYTSAESALKIIQTKRLWMRSTTCMNDFREVEHGFQMFHHYFSDETRKSKFAAALDKCASGVFDETARLFDQWWTHIRFNTYIASIAEHEDSEDLHGRLSMWRAFGKDVSKVAFIFRIPPLSPAGEALKLMFSPVLYLNLDGVHAMLDQVVANIDRECDFLSSLDRTVIIGWLISLMISGVTCLKHEGFEEEREWRAIYNPRREQSPFMTSSVEIISGVPQTIYKIPLDKKVAPEIASLNLADMFDRIILGPSQYPLVMAEAFENALTEAGVADANKRIRASEIPLRT